MGQATMTVTPGQNDQTAMKTFLEDPKLAKRNTVCTPWKFFNNYPNTDIGPRWYTDDVDMEKVGSVWAKRGDVLVHFAENRGKEEIMIGWLDVIETMGNI